MKKVKVVLYKITPCMVVEDEQGRVIGELEAPGMNHYPGIDLDLNLITNKLEETFGAMANGKNAERVGSEVSSDNLRVFGKAIGGGDSSFNS